MALVRTFISGHEAPVKTENAPPERISLVIPAFNEEAYIGACLAAVAEHVQPFVHEIIVVNNNSTDRTADVVAAFPGVTCVFEPAKGITRARQCGFTTATGDILAFIDADTVPVAGWVDQIAERFGRDEKLACLSGPYDYHDLPAVRRWIASAWFVAAWPVYRLCGYMMVGGNFAIRRRALEQMEGFDETIAFYGEDVDIARRARKCGRVEFRRSFVMPTSARRLESQGHVKTAAIYLVNFLSIACGGRPVTHGYTDPR